MPSITIPGAGLAGYWNEGESGWKPGMDENLARLSALVQLSVPSLTAALAPAAGVQVAPTGHANAGDIAAHINGAWWFYKPAAGTRAWVRDAGASYLYDGTAWVREPSAAHVVSTTTASRAITEAEFASGAIIKVDSENDVVLTVPAPSGAAPALGSSTARHPVHIARRGTGGVSVVAAAGSTLLSADGLFSARARYSAFSVIPMGDDEYLVSGDLA